MLSKYAQHVGSALPLDIVPVKRLRSCSVPPDSDSMLDFSFGSSLDVTSMIHHCLHGFLRSYEVKVNVSVASSSLETVMDVGFCIMNTSNSSKMSRLRRSRD